MIRLLWRFSVPRGGTKKQKKRNADKGSHGFVKYDKIVCRVFEIGTEHSELELGLRRR